MRTTPRGASDRTRSLAAAETIRQGASATGSAVRRFDRGRSGRAPVRTHRELRESTPRVHCHTGSVRCITWVSDGRIRGRGNQIGSWGSGGVRSAERPRTATPVPGDLGCTAATPAVSVRTAGGVRSVATAHSRAAARSLAATPTCEHTHCDPRRIPSPNGEMSSVERSRCAARSHVQRGGRRTHTRASSAKVCGGHAGPARHCPSEDRARAR